MRKLFTSFLAGAALITTAILTPAPAQALAAMNFTDSSSYTDAAHQVEIVYVAYFGRAGDPTGVTYWEGNLSSGDTITDVAASFAASSEAQTKYPFLAFPELNSDSFRTTFISEVYQNLFDRSPDSTGLAYWDGQLEGFQATYASNMNVGQLQASVANMILTIVTSATNSSSGNDITTEQAKTSVGLFFTGALAAITTTVFNTEARSEATSIVTNTTATNVSSQESAITSFMSANSSTLTNPAD